MAWHCDRRAGCTAFDRRPVQRTSSDCAVVCASASDECAVSAEEGPPRCRIRGAAPRSIRRGVRLRSAPIKAGSGPPVDEFRAAQQQMSFGSVTPGLVAGWWQGRRGDGGRSRVVHRVAEHVACPRPSGGRSGSAAVSVFEGGATATVHPAMVAAPRPGGVAGSVELVWAERACDRRARTLKGRAPGCSGRWRLLRWGFGGHTAGIVAAPLLSIPGAASLDARLPSSAEAPMGPFARSTARSPPRGCVRTNRWPGRREAAARQYRRPVICRARERAAHEWRVLGVAQALFTPQGSTWWSWIKNLTDSPVAQGAVTESDSAANCRRQQRHRLRLLAERHDLVTSDGQFCGLRPTRRLQTAFLHADRQSQQPMAGLPPGSRGSLSKLA